jgi:cell division protein FtsZ
MGIRGITDLITVPGIINLDFRDVKLVIKNMGRAMMGTGEGVGENRAIKAVEEALSNPLLEDININGASAALVNITGAPDMTLFEFDEAAKRIMEEIGHSKATIKIGTAFMKELEGKVKVSIFATGMTDGEERGGKKQEAEEAKKEEVKKDIPVEKTKEEIKEERAEKEKNNNNNDDEESDNIPRASVSRGGGRTGISSRNNINGNDFVMPAPVIVEKLDTDEKSTGFLSMIFGNSRSDKKSDNGQQTKQVVKTKNKEIEISSAVSKSDVKNDGDLFTIPAYLRKKK